MNIETTTCISLEHIALLQLHATQNNMSVRTFISALISFFSAMGKSRYCFVQATFV